MWWDWYASSDLEALSISMLQVPKCLFSDQRHEISRGVLTSGIIGMEESCPIMLNMKKPFGKAGKNGD
jgi:hypothetical protein